MTLPAGSGAPHIQRPCLEPGFAARNVRGQDPEFRGLRRAARVTEDVVIEVTGAPPFKMRLRKSDDRVSGTYFFYGRDSYEGLSCIVFSAIARNAETVFDVGAHAGVYSLLAAASGAEQVEAFEPVPTIARRFARNVKLSGFRDIITMNEVAISSKLGTMNLHYDPGIAMGTGASLEAIANRDAREGRTTMRVPVLTLDYHWKGIDRPHVGLIKIDVEKHEREVLAGALTLLSSCGPALLTEVLSRAEFEKLFGFLSQHGYQWAYAIDDDLLTIDIVRPDLSLTDGRPFVFRRYQNILFTRGPLPTSIAADIESRAEASPLPFPKTWRFAES